MVAVVHMPIWDKLVEEEYAPDPPADVPCCDHCGRRYAILLPHGPLKRLQCGVCYRQRLMERRKRREEMLNRLFGQPDNLNGVT